VNVRVGLLDIAAFGGLIVALVLPTPSRPVTDLYVRQKAPMQGAIAEAQADLARDPRDGKVAARLVDLLVQARQTDWALRAGAQASVERSADRWRVMAAVSAAHVDRLEIGPAYEWADKALAACAEVGEACADFERARLEIYVAALKAGFDSGIDPRTNRQGFVDAVKKASPLIRLGAPK
jgi:hypothetical protein